jgi:hypothetical protein
MSNLTIAHVAELLAAFDQRLDPRGKTLTIEDRVTAL